jgi:hypothetical protein
LRAALRDAIFLFPRVEAAPHPMERHIRIPANSPWVDENAEAQLLPDGNTFF